MLRRAFVKSSTLASLGLGMQSCNSNTRLQSKQSISHYLSLSFDDGFKKSFNKAAEIHEEYGLKGCFNVIATVHLPRGPVSTKCYDNLLKRLVDIKFLKIMPVGEILKTSA